MSRSGARLPSDVANGLLALSSGSSSSLKLLLRVSITIGRRKEEEICEDWRTLIKHVSIVSAGRAQPFIGHNARLPALKCLLSMVKRLAQWPRLAVSRVTR